MRREHRNKAQCIYGAYCSEFCHGSCEKFFSKSDMKKFSKKTDQLKSAVQELKKDKRGSITFSNKDKSMLYKSKGVKFKCSGPLLENTNPLWQE